MFRFILKIAIVIAALSVLILAGLRFLASGREVASVGDIMPEGGRFVGEIFVQEAGPPLGKTVLLIHGSVGWSGLWAETITDLSRRGYRVMAIDLPPMGLSGRRSDDDYSRQAQAERILTFVRAAGIKPVLVAHSFGADAGMEAVLRSAEDFSGAIVVAGALGLGQDGAGQTLPVLLRSEGMREVAVSATVTNPWITRVLLSKFVHRKDAITEAHIETINRPFRREGSTEALAKWLPTLLVLPVGAVSSDEAAYGPLDLPVSIVWGREDTVTPPDQAEALHAALQNETSIFWIEDVGHIPQIEAPDLFHETLAAALEALDL